MWSGCDEPTPPTTVSLPENLMTVITVSGMTVDVEATADKANFFTTTYETDQGTTEIQTNDGVSSFTYTENGEYVIVTRAHTSFSDYIEKTDTITIDLPIDSIGGYTTPLSYPGYTLVWNDEFDGTSLSSDWVHETGDGCPNLCGWGNSEEQYYLSQNTTVEDGYLTITAKQQNIGSQVYTSSRIKTQGIQSFQYGRVDIRAKLPYGKGMWPALWMLGDNITSNGWPSCGEIDIMELVGGTPYLDRTVYGTIHWDQSGSHASYGNNTSLPTGRFSDEFHVFSIIWDSNSIKWYMDDQLYNTADITPQDLSEFHQSFFFIFNIAVGGEWPGSPDNSTLFPQTMIVDYVRVFQ